MADLAKVEAGTDRRRRVTTNRDTVIPNRRNTNAPELEVNSRIITPNEDAARQLQATLGLLDKATAAFTDLGYAKQDEKAKQEAGQGALDGAQGKKDEARFAASKAYRKAYSVEGARTTAFTVDADVTQKVQERLLDEDDPADLQDINDIVDHAFGAAALDENGKPIDFGDPQAQLIMARQFGETRARLLTGAREVIKTREDNRLVDAIGYNVIQEGLQKGTEPGQKFTSFEEAMGRVPPTVDRGFAKKRLLRAFLVRADELADPKILDGLQTSTRKDGSPSFTPEEIGTIRDTRDAIANKVRIEAERVQRERYEATSEKLMSDWAQGRTPSISQIRDLERQDLIPGQMAFTLIHNIESEAKAEERERRADARAAAAANDADDDYSLAGLLEGRLSGDLRGSSFEDDTARLRRGEFGTGKKAMVRFNRARAAARTGATEALRSPEAATYAEQLKNFYGKQSGGSRVVAALGGNGNSVGYPAMAADYRRRITKGEAPSEAYLGAIATYGTGESRERAQAGRLKVLRAKQGR